MAFAPRFWSYLFIAVAAAAGASPEWAWADDGQAQAEKLIRNGVELRRRHDDEAAAREFQKAYDLVHSPRAAGQLGLAEQALGRWEDAERHLIEAIRAADDPWVTKNRAALDLSMNTILAHLGRVEVIGDPEGAEVSVNARPVGKLPLAEPVHVSAGQVDIEMHAPGYLPVQRTVSIVGGQYQRVVIRLAKEAAPADQTKPSTSAETPSVQTAPRPAVAQDQPSSTRLALKWTAAGLAGAGLVTGVLFTILHHQNVSSFDESCRVKNGVGVSKADGMTTDVCDPKYQTSLTYQKVFIVGYAAAGAFAATWLILQLTEPSHGRTTEQALRRPMCGPVSSGYGVSCAIRF